MNSQMLKCDHIYLEDVAMYLYKYIILYYVMLNYLALIINKSQVKIIFGQKIVIMPTFDHHIITRSQNLCMNHNINILVIFTMLLA